MPSETLIQSKNLIKKYGDFPAVNGVDFEVKTGECFGFLGPNGAGKSTLMKMIYCFSPRTSGNLTVFGMDPDKKAPEIKNRLGVAAQSDNLDEEITVAQNLEIYGRYFGLAPSPLREKIAELLKFMALETRADSKVDDLSGGMKRRLVIARALLNDPDLIILDEPTTGLDPQVRHLIWAKLRDLKKQGVTLLLTTHYMEEAQQLCDRLLVIDKGKVLVQGKPADLVKKHLKPFVMELPSSSKLPKGALMRNVRVESHEDRFFLYSASPSALEKIAEASKKDFQIRPTGLEDLFLKLTGRDLHESE
jgi:lipooligosaccharide transport system ATP-binding protein